MAVTQRFVNVSVQHVNFPTLTYLNGGTGHGNGMGPAVTVFACRCNPAPPLTNAVTNQPDYQITATDPTGNQVVLFSWRCTYSSATAPSEFRA
jgi:hypothetical protein